MVPDRILAAAGETGKRRNQRPPRTYTKPSLTATTPNQVWTWDITKLATTRRGVSLMAYLTIDLFSRYVVAWMLATKECKHLTAQLFAETIARHGIAPVDTFCGGNWSDHAERRGALEGCCLASIQATVHPQG